MNLVIVLGTEAVVRRLAKATRDENALTPRREVVAKKEAMASATVDRICIFKGAVAKEND
jgi:hypothetical protein